MSEDVPSNKVYRRADSHRVSSSQAQRAASSKQLQTRKRSRDSELHAVGAASPSFFPHNAVISIFPGGKEVGKKRAAVLESVVSRMGGTTIPLTDILSVGCSREAADQRRRSPLLIVVGGVSTVQDLARIAQAELRSSGQPASLEAVTAVLRSSTTRCISVQWITDTAQMEAPMPVERYALHDSNAAIPKDTQPSPCLGSVQCSKTSVGRDGAGETKEGFIPVFFGDGPSPFAAEAARQEKGQHRKGSDERVEWVPPPLTTKIGVAQGTKSKTPRGFVCQRGASSGNSSEGINTNSMLLGKLQELASIYEACGDHWRKYAYSRAIGIIKRYGRPITSSADLKSYRGIGERILAKIDEILTTGSSAKLEYLHSRDDVRATEEFVQIWGVGPSAAHCLVQLGMRSISEVRHSADAIASLTPTQLIGLSHYEDLSQRIPRREVQHIELTVVKTLNSLFAIPVFIGEPAVGDEERHSSRKGIQVVTCGSYRRGKPTCGDVDILICDRSEKLADGLLSLLVDALERSRLIVAHLARGYDSRSNTWMGIVQVPDCSADEAPSCPCSHRQPAECAVKVPYCYNCGVHFSRRLDLKVYSTNEFPFAVLYFTGSDYFNRSMRLYCQRKSMSLSDRSLIPVIRVRREKVHEFPTAIACCTEQEIFAAVGLPFKEPHERDV